MVLPDSFILRRGKVIIHLPVISNFNGVSLESASFFQHPLSILRTCGCLSLLKRPLHERDK